MAGKSGWERWRATRRDRQDGRAAPPRFFEPLEPRILLSVMVEHMQVTQPATPEDYTAYISEHTETVQPTAEQTSIWVVMDGANTKVRVTMTFQDSGYYASNWGQVQQDGNTRFVNAEVQRSTGGETGGAMTLTHDYDLGALASGDYVFEFRVWDQLVKSREFRPGSEQWVLYVPTAQQTNLFFMADGAVGTKARVAIDFNDSGYRVSHWGTVRQVGNTLVVDAQVEHWTGGATCVVTPVSHDYDLGVLPEGGYLFQFSAWQQPVESQEFATSELLQPVYRFWSPKYERHFYTIRPQERDKIINNYPHVWTYEQVAFYAWAQDTNPDASPVYRFWSGGLNSHFYTMSQAERDKLINDPMHVWTYEGVAFYAYTWDHRPLGTNLTYRFWSGQLGSHFFTTSTTEAGKVFNSWSHIWEFEGFAWHVCGA